MQRVLYIFLLMLSAISASGQYVIKGKVRGADDGLPLPQVTVLEKGTDNGTPTDANGEFELEVSSKDVVLIFRYLGYITQEIEPRFDGPVLIKLRPDCNKDFFYSPHLKLIGAWDIVNSQIGGRVEFRLPYWLNYHAITTHDYYPFDENEYIYKADASVNVTPMSCSMDIFLKYQYQDFQLPSEGLNLRTSVISTGLEPGETKYILGFGFGNTQEPEGSRKLWAIQAGFEKTWYFGYRSYLPVSMTATRWNGFWDFQVSTSRSFGPMESRLALHLIDGFAQLQLGVGFYLRLRKLHESEKANRKNRRSKGARKHRHISE